MRKGSAVTKGHTSPVFEPRSRSLVRWGEDRSASARGAGVGTGGGDGGRPRSCTSKQVGAQVPSDSSLDVEFRRSNSSNRGVGLAPSFSFNAGRAAPCCPGRGGPWSSVAAALSTGLGAAPWCPMAPALSRAATPRGLCRAPSLGAGLCGGCSGYRASRRFLLEAALGVRVLAWRPHLHTQQHRGRR